MHTTVAAAAAAASPLPGSKKGVRRWENGFEIHNLSMGSDPYGKLALAGKTAKVRYVGRLATNGKVFDKSGPKPFAFRLGVGQVIKGWDKGVEGMRVGDKRKLVIPPQMAYGSQKMGSIPPNSTLEFEVRTREPESAVCMHGAGRQVLFGDIWEEGGSSRLRG